MNCIYLFAFIKFIYAGKQRRLVLHLGSIHGFHPLLSPLWNWRVRRVPSESVILVTGLSPWVSIQQSFHCGGENTSVQSYRIASYGECDSSVTLTDTDHVTFPSCLPKGTAVVSRPCVSCDSFIFELVINQNSPGVAFHNIHRQFKA